MKVMKKVPVMKACSHLEKLFDIKSRTIIVKELIALLKPHLDEFDAIAVSGYSMALVVPILAYKLKKEIILVRKDSEERHSSHNVEGKSDQRVVFVDDLISSRSTYNHVEKGLRTIDCTIVGIVMYEDAYPWIKETDPLWGCFRVYSQSIGRTDKVKFVIQRKEE
jgi:adenine/guanine phosphoribosyltransferase-like PRPP-binding protein